MKKIPNYTIERELGRGGMATVYLAVQDMLHRYVALKVMLPELIRDENFRKSFLSEGSTIASLQHSNIVSIHDIGITDDSVFYMAMEYLSGGSLRDILTKGKLSYSHIIFILEELASGLSYAHKKGYIHRDIKPGNILFRDNGVAVLSDFGIAKLKGSSGDMTRMGFTQGTLQYMSPEQVTTSSLDHRSDIYSLGLVFYEMLTGDRSFFTNTSLQNILQRPIPQLPDEYAFLQTVLDKVLSIKPEERYQDADEFVRAIKTADHLANTASFVVQEKQESNDDDTTQYYPADRIYPQPQPKQKKTGLLLASLFVLFGASAFGAYQYFLSVDTSTTSPTPQHIIDNDKQQTLAEQRAINEKVAEQARLKQMTIQKAEAEKKAKEQAKKDKLAKQKLREEQQAELEQYDRERVEAEERAKKEMLAIEEQQQLEEQAKKERLAEKKRKEKQLAEQTKLKQITIKKQTKAAKKTKEQARQKLAEEKAKKKEQERKKRLAKKKAIEKAKKERAAKQNLPAKGQAQIRVSVTLNGRPLNTYILVSKNGKRVRVAKGKSSAIFNLPVGRYTISANYNGTKSTAVAILEKGDIVIQQLVFRK